jgi:hypothetical protein
MTTRRRLLVFGPLAVAALVVGMWLLWPRTAITRENAAKIQAGMTLAEVEAILGGPARDEATGHLTADLERRPEEDEPGWEFRCEIELMFVFRNGAWFSWDGVHEWSSDRVIIQIACDSERQVRWMRCMAVRRVQERPLLMLRRLLRL